MADNTPSHLYVTLSQSAANHCNFKRISFCAIALQFPFTGNKRLISKPYQIQELAKWKVIQVSAYFWTYSICFWRFLSVYLFMYSPKQFAAVVSNRSFPYFIIALKGAPKIFGERREDLASDKTLECCMG